METKARVPEPGLIGYSLAVHVQTLSSGSEGNATLIRAGELSLLVDAGLTARELYNRLEAARIAPKSLDHVFITHGHLDHCRSAGIIGKRQEATVHCAENIMRNRALARSPKLSVLRPGTRVVVENKHTGDEIGVRAVPLPHDCDPTVGFRIDHEDRVCVVLSDIGVPKTEVAEQLLGAHVLLLEFNYDPDSLDRGPYPDSLKQRIRGGRGHLSNEQAATMLEWLAGPELHTLVITHVSSKNNTHELALAVARKKLEQLGLTHVQVLVADQHEIGPNLAV